MHMWHPEASRAEEVARRLLDFATTWINQHILGTDREMARGYFSGTGQAIPAVLGLS
jgi:hemerythrin